MRLDHCTSAWFSHLGISGSALCSWLEMAVENQRGHLVDEDGSIDRFPVGMRVLAVDDDPTCLKLLENLLRKCQYQGSLPLLLCFFVLFWFSEDSVCNNNCA